MPKQTRRSNAKKRPTLQDVAKLAGVSTAVVSYVINAGPRPTSAEVQERVEKAVKALNYHPNAFARGLRSRRTKTIGYFVFDYDPLSLFMAQYSATILTGLTTRLKEKGYHILIFPIVIGEDLRDVDNLLHSERLDGIVLRLIDASAATTELLERIAAAAIPCVCIEEPVAEHFGFSSVTYDDRSGAYEATSYLLKQGHRRIGYIQGDLRYGSARRRLEGYQHALTDFGIPYDEALVQGAHWFTSTIGDSVAQLLALPTPPTAIFSASDNMAFVAINELRSHHFRVPDDLAVVGFDDVDFASKFFPTLSTVHIPLLEIGQQAAEIIVEHVETDDAAEARLHIFPVEFIPRASG